MARKKKDLKPLPSSNSSETFLKSMGIEARAVRLEIRRIEQKPRRIKIQICRLEEAPRAIKI